MGDERWQFRLHDANRRGRASLAMVLLILLVVFVVVALVRRGGTRQVQVTTGSPRTSTPPASKSRSTADAPTGAGTTSTVGGASGPLLVGDFDGCPVTGDGGDRDLNRLKNRSFEGPYAPVSLDDLVALPWPTEIGGQTRRRWAARARAQVAPHEARAVSVEGFLVKARASGPESTNCHGDAARYRDYHLWLTSARGAGRERSLIVEMTPRLRAMHSNWNIASLNAIVASGDRVRASGWLLLDQEHPEQIGKTRGTIWEVHPVTRFEVQRGGRWLSLDDVSFARRSRGRR